MTTVKNDRDASIERLLRDTLRTQTAAESGPCLDAETLAAWSDGALTARDRAAAEAHAAGCVRCQTLIAAMIKTAAPPTRTARWRAPFVTWLVPLTAAATAVIAWAVLPDRSSPRKQDQPASAVATVARARDAVAPETVPATPAANPSSEPARRARPARQAAANPPPAAAAKTVRPGGKDALADLQEGGVTARNESASARAASAGAVETTQPSAVTPTAAAPALSAPLAAPAVSGPSAAPAPAVAEKSSAPQPPPAAGNGATAEAAQARLGAAAAATAPPVTARRTAAVTSAFRAAPETLIVSPVPAVRWRILGSGALQRSVDGGASWQLQQLAAAAPLLAGAAPSPTICWLVGKNGTVLLSTDGRSWRRVAFPETADLISIRATDGRTATVTTADGRTFTTADAGQTWTR